jgi:WD40 repeat protein/predicted Ser/Thr protein kinase
MTSVGACSNCGGPLAAQAVDGLCLKCLGRLAFGSDGAPDDAPALTRLGDYDLIKELARGGMGVVYQARQRGLNRVVALKVLLHGPFTSPDFVQRFRREAEAAAALRHPNIVPVYEIGEHAGHHFLSMEFIEGASFAELVREQPLAPARAAGYVAAIALALQHAHEHGVLHRDLKPSNVLLDAFDQPRVTDFGLAKLVNRDGEITMTGQVLGSPNHMPPEQAAGKFSETTAASDVYSIGSILYQLLTGRPPFQGETLHEILLQVQNVEPVSPRRLRPNIPADLETICLKCLQKEPAKRYRSAADLAADLQAFLAGEPIQARPVGGLERAWLWCRRRPVLAAMALALVAIAACGLAGILWQWHRAEANARGEMIQRLAAEDNAEKMRLNLYAADVNVAAQAVQNDNYGFARRILDNLRPGPGQADLRGFEWRYLWDRCRGNELASFSGHKWIVNSTAFSPDGKMIASSSVDGTVRLWDVAGRQCVKTLELGTNAVMCVSFTPDGKNLMAGGVSGVEIFNLENWQVAHRFPAQLASLSREGTLMATADSSPFYYEKSGDITLWNWQTGQKLRDFGHSGHSLALSPDGHRLAVALTSPGVDLYDADSGNLLRKLATTNPVWHLSFSPDGSWLLATGWSSDVLLWDLKTNAPPRILAAHRLTAWSAVFSPDGKMIATTGSDQTVRLWDADSLALLSELHGHASEVWCAAFSPDGKTLATGGKDCNVMLWSAKPARPLCALPEYRYWKPIFSPDGRKIVTFKPDGENRAQLWNLEDPGLQPSSFAGGRLVVGVQPGGGGLVSFDAGDLKLQFWDWDGNGPAGAVNLEAVPRQKHQFECWGTSREGGYFFTADGDGLIQVWDVKSGKLSSVMHGPAPPLRAAVLSGLGRFLMVSVTRENVVHLYDCRTRQEFILVGHKDFVSGLAFSPDDQTAATGSVDGNIRLWRTATGELTATLPGHIEETTDLVFSPDGRTLASIGHLESLKLWHLPTLREVFSESIPNAGLALQFSPDGHRLAYTTDDNQLRILNAP